MVDAVSFDHMNPNWHGRHAFEGKASHVPSKDFSICSPFLRGFSFAAKQWLRLEVDGVSEIEFATDAFETMVLDQATKKTIEKIVTSFDQKVGLDLIEAKSEGLIINLAGPPGVGKVRFVATYRNDLG